MSDTTHRFIRNVFVSFLVAIGTYLIFNLQIHLLNYNIFEFWGIVSCLRLLKFYLFDYAA